MPETSLPSALYVRLSDNQLCFARYAAGVAPRFVFMPYRLRPQASLTVNLREAAASLDILSEASSKVRVVVTGSVTPVPLAEFQEEDCEQIYRYCFAHGEEKRRVFYDTVPSANAVLLFSLEESVCRALEDTFGEVRYASALTAVLDHFCTRASGQTPGKRTFVYCFDGHAMVAVFEESRLVMTNVYAVQNENDAMYYVFGVASRLGIDLAKSPFFIAGDGHEALVEAMSGFAAKVYSVNRAGEYNRHVVATTPGVPYDMVCLLLK